MNHGRSEIISDSSEQSPANRHSGLQFTVRLLMAITAGIAFGFACPLEPMIYLVNIVLFTTIVAVPIIVLWLIFTPTRQWRDSLGAAARFFVLAVAAFATLLIMVLVRMEVLGQDF